MNSLDEKHLEEMDLELATFARRVTAASLDKKLGTLERSSYLLLHHLSSHGPNGVKSLSEQFHLDISTISRQAAGLEAKGLVRRLPDPADGRASHFELTETGQKELLVSQQARVSRFAKLFADWTPEECESFLRLLAKLNRTFVD
ncbi:MarR family winged helix-turn-helix transcriptional regulator [Paenibacillus ginsengarvi]|uniref:MarR family winged helix-turn-helix transcriptional regulator n=1 Tax=Paenibacillus ginsengarvi TaxID=400777 RepID=UPI001EFFC81E|nr:MarR family transcriptional regulator [Paenibacillus ginsengarvi]